MQKKQNKNTMLRTIVSILLLIVTFPIMAQTDAELYGVTKFLGIPVDGTKSEMMQKLRQKGFTYKIDKDLMVGEFNGIKDAAIAIVTNHDKVWRIAVIEPPQDEYSVKRRWNVLCEQFEQNRKYIASNLLGDYELSDEEDVSLGISQGKQYQASYLQSNIQVPIDSTLSETEQSAESQRRLRHLANCSVWMTIVKADLDYRNPYNIIIYYDNKYNQANGEDL